MISEKDKERVLDICNIEDVIGRFVELRKDGARFKGHCPFHQEKTPSFIVTPSRNMFYCFGCHEGGDAISFIKKYHNLTYVEAVRWLASEYNIQLEEQPESESAEDRLQAMKRESMLNANRSAMEFFTEQINADNDNARFALEYAGKRWGKSYVQQEGIGFAPGKSSLTKYLTERGYSIETLTTIGLVREKDGRYYDGFYNRIVIPIKDRTGNVIGFTARVLDDSKPKYINSCISVH